jgi:tetratricopeptide (TPR) repeat protein
MHPNRGGSLPARNFFTSMKTVPQLLRCLMAIAVLTFLAPRAGAAVDGGNAAPPAPAANASIEATNSQDLLRAYVQLQEQLHAAQLAIEQNRKEARDAASHSAEVLAARLQSIEQALASQRAGELEAMRSSNRVLLIVAGTFAGVGFLGMVLMTIFQWRTVHNLAEISASLPSTRALGPGPILGALGPGETPLVTVGPAEKSSFQLLSALEKLEKRIHELESQTRPGLHEPGADQASQANPAEAGSSNGNGLDDSSEGSAHHIRLLLGKGESMLNLDQPEAALQCFEEVLALEPLNAEALVKKGSALERLQKIEEAIAFYDQAIAADNTLTIAYLYKGGLFNRLERFNEALECYEKALSSQEKRQANN